MQFSTCAIAGGTLVSRRRVDSDGLDPVVVAQFEPLCQRLYELAQNPEGGTIEFLLPGERTWISFTAGVPLDDSRDLIFQVGLSHTRGLAARHPFLYFGLLTQFLVPTQIEGDLRIIDTMMQESLAFQGESKWVWLLQSLEDRSPREPMNDFYDARGAVLAQFCEPDTDHLYAHMNDIIEMADYVAPFFLALAEKALVEYISLKMRTAKEAAGADWLGPEYIASLLGETAEAFREEPEK